MKEYKITQEQLDTIEHYARMFDLNAENIKELTKEERPDIVYGFRLGQYHNHLRQCFHDMNYLRDEIKKQTL